MVDPITVWAFVLTVAVPWVWLRNRELIALGMEIYAASKNGEMTEAEFQAIVDKAKPALFKAGPLRIWK